MAALAQRHRIQTAAGLYSTLTGVLAGFVFTAMIVMLSSPPASKPVESISAPLFALLMVFFLLVVTSFLYAVVTGEESSLRCEVLGLLASCLFALAAVEMFLSIAWFFSAYDLTPRVLGSTRLLFHGVVFIASVWLTANFGELVALREEREWIGNRASLLWAGPMLLLPLAGAVTRALAPGGAGDERLTNVMTISACYAIAVAVYFRVVANAGERAVRRLFPRGLEIAITVAQGALFFYCELSLPS